MNDWAAINNIIAIIAIDNGEEIGLSGKRNIVVSIPLLVEEINVVVVVVVDDDVIIVLVGNNEHDDDDDKYPKDPTTLDTGTYEAVIIIFLSSNCSFDFPIAYRTCIIRNLLWWFRMLLLRYINILNTVWEFTKRIYYNMMISVVTSSSERKLPRGYTMELSQHKSSSNH